MILLRLNEDKTLTIVSKSKIYQYENNAQQIALLVPKKIENKDVLNVRAYLFGCFDNSFGDYIELSNQTMYKNTHVQFTGNLTNRMTTNSGTLKIWIVLDSDNFKYESDYTNLTIEESKECEAYTKIEDVNAFTSCINKMRTCEQNCIDLVKSCESYKSQCEQITGLGIEIYESIKREGDKTSE